MNFRINNGNNLEANLAAYDPRGSVVFVSAFGLSTAIKAAEISLRKKTVPIDLNYRRYPSEGNAYNIYTSKVSGSDFAHFVMMRKDISDPSTPNNNDILLYVFMDNDPTMKDFTINRYSNTIFPESFLDAFYEKLYNATSIPVIRAWVPYIAESMAKAGRLYEAECIGLDRKVHDLHIICLRAQASMLSNIISEGLKNGNITINGNPIVSPELESMGGLDSYIGAHSEVFSKKIQKAFSPRFIPGISKYSQAVNDYSDYIEYNGHLKFFDAQKAVVQSISDTLKKQKSAFIIGECGTGKTAMAIGTLSTNAQFKRGQNMIIMCPSHLTNKWKTEVLRLAPLSEAIIVKDFSDLKAIESKIKDKNRLRMLWIIMSYETAKFGYQERPCAKTRHGLGRTYFICPECGQTLYKTIKVKSKKKTYDEKIPFDMFSFTSKTVINSKCMNQIKKYDSSSGRHYYVNCNAPLWQAFNKDIDYRNNNDADEWIKLGECKKDIGGWLMYKHAKTYQERLAAADIESLTKAEKEWLGKLTEYMYDDNKVIIAPRKYSLARYIRKHLKNLIDYVVLDEVHLLKGASSAQGEAMGDLATASKHVLALTGTLLNGYADGVFYLLYRMFPGMMKKDGFNYLDNKKFAYQYGVVSKSKTVKDDKNSTKNKILPGVSPLVFTQFLLESAAFITLDDMSDGLPGYKEIPVPCQMDYTTSAAYDIIVNDFKSHSDYYNGGMRYMAQFLQLLTLYPDQPWDQNDIFDPKTEELICSPVDYHPEEDLDKEAKLKELIQRKIAAGEKVLVYNNFVNKTTVNERLVESLNEMGIKAMCMSADKSKGKYMKKVSASDRESWINEQLSNGMQVLICNPSLIETGLDLLDFTTIVFYQLGYNLFTMRQASRRSWRLGQKKDIEVYFMYYEGTVQETALKLMASKLKAAMAIEGHFSEEGLNAMVSDGEGDILTQIAESVTEGIEEKIDIQIFDNSSSDNNEKGVPEVKLTIKDMKNIDTPQTLREYCLSKQKQKRKRLLINTDNSYSNLCQNYIENLRYF